MSYLGVLAPYLVDVSLVNRGAAFSLDPASPNVLRGGKRPFHTLNPGIYLKNGQPHPLYGTQGADGQPQTLAAVLTRLIDYGMDPLTALRRPRFLLGKTFSHSRDSLTGAGRGHAGVHGTCKAWTRTQPTFGPESACRPSRGDPHRCGRKHDRGT